VELATDEVCTVVGKSDLDEEGSAEELAEEGNDIDTGEPASGERENGEFAEELAEEGNSSYATSCTTEVDIMTSPAGDAQVPVEEVIDVGQHRRL